MLVQLVCLTLVGLAAMAAAAPKSEQSVQSGGSVDELKLRLLDRLLSELAAAEQQDADFGASKRSYNPGTKRLYAPLESLMQDREVQRMLKQYGIVNGGASAELERSRAQSAAGAASAPGHHSSQNFMRWGK